MTRTKQWNVKVQFLAAYTSKAAENEGWKKRLGKRKQGKKELTDEERQMVKRHGSQPQPRRTTVLWVTVIRGRQHF